VAFIDFGHHAYAIWFYNSQNFTGIVFSTKGIYLYIFDQKLQRYLVTITQVMFNIVKLSKLITLT
jgi:hypothetical protein